MLTKGEYQESSVIGWFGCLTALLSLSHIATIVLTALFSIDQDDHDPIFGPSKLNYWVNEPFLIAAALCMLLQFLSGVSVLIGYCKGRVKSVYYGSVLGLMSVFGLGVFLVNTTLQYNFGTRNFPKKTDLYPQLMPLYYTLYSTAGSSFLFMLPMNLYCFGSHLRPYLSQVKVREGKSDIQGWFLSLFLIHALAQVVLIINFYQYADAQNKVTFHNDNVVDLIISYYGIALVVVLVSVILLMKNSLNKWLSRGQSLWIAMVMSMFLAGSFISEAIITGRIFIEIYVGGQLLCTYKDCDSLNLFKWQILGYSCLNLLALLLVGPFLKLLAFQADLQSLPRDTLLTSQEVVEARQ